MPVCAHCGFEADAGARFCPLCGSDLADQGSAASSGGGSDWGGEGLGGAAAAHAASSGRPGVAAAAEPPPFAASPPAWEDPAIAFPEGLWRTWRESVLDPATFYPRVPWERPLARPVLYFLVVTLIGAFFTLWWNALGMAGTLPFAAPGADLDIGGGALALIEFFVTPFAALIGLAIWTLVLHLFALLLAPERRGLGSTARVLCYSAGPAVFSLVPVLGTFVAGIWTLVLQVFGLREAHRTTTGRAIAIVLLPIALVIVFAFTVILLGVLILGVTLFGR